MNRSKETFRVTPKMGARLRELRLKAGVTQQELAVLMGRQGKGNHRLVGMLERCKVPYPSLGFIADYLRACRASFADLAGFVNDYTSQPTVIEQRGHKRAQSPPAGFRGACPEPDRAGRKSEPMSHIDAPSDAGR